MESFDGKFQDECLSMEWVRHRVESQHQWPSVYQSRQCQQ